MDFSNFPVASLMEITARPPLVFLRGEGSWLWDNEGKKYLDFVQGWAVNCLGHCPQVVREVLTRQTELLISPSPAYFNEPAICLAELLVRHSCFDRVFFANSGAEANEGAIKLARKWGAVHLQGAYEIITFIDGFHGRTLATMSACGKPQFATLFEPKVPGFPKARLNDIESVRRLINEKTVAVMLEPIQGEAGVIAAEVSFLRELRELTEEHGLLLIVDEIQTGVGRTGKLWGYEHGDIEPDIMTLGKMLGGGVPLAALLAKEQACCFGHGDQGGTYNGNPLMTAVGRAILETVLAPGFLDDVTAKGEFLAGKLEALSTRCSLGAVRGKGLLHALDLGSDIGGVVVDRAREKGLLLNSPRPNLLRFMPSLTVSRDEIEMMAAILEDCVTSG